MNYMGLENYLKLNLYHRPFLPVTENDIEANHPSKRQEDIDAEVKASILSMLSSEEKYKFLVGNINDITFKNAVVEYEDKGIIEEIMKDIVSNNAKSFSESKYLQSDIEKNIRRVLESEEKYRFLIDNMGEIIFICDSFSIFKYLNTQWNLMLGYDSECGVGSCLLDFIHDEDLPILKEKVTRLFSQSIKIVNFEYRLKDIEGNWKYHLMTGTPIHDQHGNVKELLGVSRDITDRKLLQMKMRDFNEQLEKKVKERTSEINLAYQELERVNTKLIQSEKMAVVGELCSGVAHEFNNLIGIMHAYAEFTRSQPTEKNVNKFVDAVLISSRRAKTIIQSLLSFARRIEPLKEPANINNVIEEVLLLLETDFRKENILVIKDFDTNISNIVFDVGQIEQVLLNLLVNAKHALHDKKPQSPKIVISTRNGLDYITINITDNGVGIKKAHIDKIFQPFFSTKGAYGKNKKIPGAGLGLSVSLGIIESHQGKLEVESEENQWTTFTITMPKNPPPKLNNNNSLINPENKNNVSANPQKNIANHAQYRKVASILVVDDEEYLRSALCDILANEGYNLMQAEDGETAVNLLSNSRIDLVIMDIMMPGINGFDTIKIMRNMNPDIKIIILSGSTNYYLNNSISESDVQGVIFKPFELDNLLSMISNVVGE